MALMAVIHTVGHLIGPVNTIANETDIDKLNSFMIKKKWDRTVTYVELLFTTIPGFTGLVALISMLIIFFGSLPCVRRKKWECFSYLHLLYYIFFGAIFLHGFEGWLNTGLPPSALFTLILFLAVLYQMIKRNCEARVCRTIIEKVYLTSDRSYVYIKLFKPAGMLIHPGQWMFLNLPKFSRHQWHPFSIASGTHDDTINFIIKNTGGGFTNALVQEFESQPYRNQAQEDTLDVFEISVDSADSARASEQGQRVDIRLNGPFGAPCQSAIYKHTCVFVGAGVGLTPFLAFLRSVPRNIVFMTFVFICRDPELMRWISLSVQSLDLSQRELSKLQILLFLTKRKELDSLESFLFWRGFLKMEKRQKMIEQIMGKEQDLLFGLPIKVSYERPNLEKIMIETAHKSARLGNHYKEVSVYSCAPHSFNQRLAKVCKQAKQKVPKYSFELYPEVFS